MNKFKVGDRVAVYGFGSVCDDWEFKGVITEIPENDYYVLVKKDGQSHGKKCHPKQCRKLVRKVEPDIRPGGFVPVKGISDMEIVVERLTKLDQRLTAVEIEKKALEKKLDALKWIDTLRAASPLFDEFYKKVAWRICSASDNERNND